MLIFEWLKSFLGFFGWWPKKCKLVIMGLDNAGKTTLLQRLKDDHFKSHPPTYHPTCESFTVDGLTITAYDLGGHYHARKVWKEYLPAVDGIVFVVDAADVRRFEEARSELDSLLSDEQVLSVPILVLANKVDRHDAVGEEEIKQSFNLFGVLTGKEDSTKAEGTYGGGRPMELFMSSVLKRQGYGHGLRWLATQLKKQELKQVAYQYLLHC